MSASEAAEIAVIEATGRLRQMPYDWPEHIAERVLTKLARCEDRQSQVDVIARYLLFAYLKGRA